MSAEVFGREAELEELAKLLEPLRHGSSVRVGLMGDAGVGKTTLLDLAAWRVGVSTVRIAGFEHGMGQPMRGLLELVRALPTTAWSSITPADRQVLDAVGGHGVMNNRPALMDALVTLFSAAVSAEPMLLVIEDAQWLDTSTEEVLAALLPRLEGDALGVLLTTRPTTNSLTKLVILIPVEGLDEGPATALGQSLGLAGAVAESLQKLTRGNPLATMMAARSLSSQQRVGVTALPEIVNVGPRLVDAYLPILESLPEVTLRALAVIAAGEGASDDLLLAALGTLQLGTDDLGPAERAGLVAGIRFVHPVIRTSVYVSISVHWRTAAHRSLSTVLSPEADPERWAWHVAESDAFDPDAVSDALNAAGEAAYARGARLDAARYFERSAVLTTDIQARFDRYWFAAKLVLFHGQSAVASPLVHMSLQAAPSSLDKVTVETFLYGFPPLTAQSVRSCWEFLTRESTANLSIAPEVSLFQALCATQLILIEGDFWALSDVVSLAEQALKKAPAVPGLMVQLGREISDALVFGRSDFASTAAVGEMALETEHAVVPERVGLGGDPTAGFTIAAAALLADEQWDFATQILERLAVRNEVTGWHVVFSELPVWRVEAYWRVGRWSEGFLAGSAALNANDDRQSMERATYLLATMAKVQMCLGRVEEAELLIRRAATESAPAVMGSVAAIMAHARGLGCLAQQHCVTARAHLEEVRDWAELGQLNHPGWMWWEADYIEALAKCGDAGAGERAEELLRRAEHADLAVVKGQALRCRGLAADGALAEVAFQQSIDILATSPAVFERARSFLALAEFRDRQGDVIGARHYADHAVTLFAKLGAAVWLQRAAELSSAHSTAGPASTLSNRELSVALLVANGQSNKQVAAEMGISSKTMEFHLGNVFRKLQLTGRAGLIRAMSQPA